MPLSADANSTAGMGRAEQMARQYYQSCMDTEEIEKRKAQPLLDFLNDYKTKVKQDPSQWSLQSMVEFTHSLGVEPFFSFTVGLDDKNTNRSILLVNTANLKVTLFCSLRVIFNFNWKNFKITCQFFYQ